MSVTTQVPKDFDAENADNFEDVRRLPPPPQPRSLFFAPNIATHNALPYTQTAC